MCARGVQLLPIQRGAAPAPPTASLWVPPHGATISCAAVASEIVVAALGGPRTLHVLLTAPADALAERLTRTSLGKRARERSTTAEWPSPFPAQTASCITASHVSAVAVEVDGPAHAGRCWLCAATTWALDVTVYRISGGGGEGRCIIVPLVAHRLSPDLHVFEAEPCPAGDTDGCVHGSTELTPESLLLLPLGGRLLRRHRHAQRPHDGASAAGKCK